MVDHAGLNSDGHNVMCCVLRYKLFMPISLSIQLFTQQTWLSDQLYVFCVNGGHLLGYELNFLGFFSELLIRISLTRVTSVISTSYTRSNSRNSSLIQTDLLLTNGCEKPKQSRKKRGHLFKSQSKTFLYFVHTLKVFLFWHRRHVSVFLDSFEEDADLTIV